MMTSKDENKRKYANGTKKEAEKAPPKKQITIDDDNDNDDDSWSTDDYSLEPKEEEMNLPTGSKEELLIR
jgi:hypothetical protein